MKITEIQQNQNPALKNWLLKEGERKFTCWSQWTHIAVISVQWCKMLTGQQTDKNCCSVTQNLRLDLKPVWKQDFGHFLTEFPMGEISHWFFENKVRGRKGRRVSFFGGVGWQAERSGEESCKHLNGAGAANAASLQAEWASSGGNLLLSELWLGAGWLYTVIQIPSLLCQVDPVQTTLIHNNLHQLFSIGHTYRIFFYIDTSCFIILDEGKLNIKMEGLDCQKLDISLAVWTGLRDLGWFIAALSLLLSCVIMSWQMCLAVYTPEV